MKLTQIANLLREIADSIESVAKIEDLDFPDAMVIPLVTNTFINPRTPEALLKSAARPKT